MPRVNPHRLAPLLCAAVLVCLPTASRLGQGSAEPAHAAAMAYPKGTKVLLHRKAVYVTIQGYAFSPAIVAVSVGTQIIWTNDDSVPHTVYSAKHVWVSNMLNHGVTFKRVFGKAGTYLYECSIHPFMLGTVIVSK